MENSYKMLNSLTNINDFILYLRNLLIPTRRHVALYLLFTYMAAFRYVLPNHSVELDSEILGNFSFKRSAFCVLVLGSFINRVYSIKRTVMVSLSIAHRQLGVSNSISFKNRPSIFLGTVLDSIPMIKQSTIFSYANYFINI